MPIYQFKCHNCHKEFEQLVLTTSDKEESKCPHCGSTDVEKLIAASSFQLKGGGWARDKYSGGGRKK